MDFVPGPFSWVTITLPAPLIGGVLLIALSNAPLWRRIGWGLLAATVVLFAAGLIWTWIVDAPQACCPL